MAELSIAITGARMEPYAAVPTIAWTLRLTERTRVRIHALALHAQVRIVPKKRRYGVEEQDRLVTLFGLPHQWGDSLRPFLWATLDTVLAGFQEEAVVEVPMACTYDFEVAASRYLHAVKDGEVPIAMLFSGTVFRGGAGFVAEPVPWDLEASYRLPVDVWRDVMDHHFPGQGWVRLERPTIERLERYRAAEVLATSDQAMAALLKAAGADS